MKKILLPAFLFYTFSCVAQKKIPYANFIQTDTAVKWAAIYNSYVNLTPVNPNFNIRAFYLNKLKKQSIKAYSEDSIYLKVTPVKMAYADIFKKVVYKPFDASKTMNWYFNYDEKIDASDQVLINDSNNCDTCFMKNRLSFFKIKQLLYYKSNQINIKNILIAPVVYKKSAGASKEEAQFAEWANVAFDNSETPISIPASAVFIGRSANLFELLHTTDDPINTAKILTLNNWSLSSQLFRDAKKDKVKFYDTEQGIYPTAKSILKKDTIERYHLPMIEVPMFDMDGNLTSSKLVSQEINFDSLYNYKIIQDFYFDFKNEKLYSKLIAFAFQKKVFVSDGTYLGLTDHWGVIFPEKRKQVKSKPR